MYLLEKIHFKKDARTPLFMQLANIVTQDIIKGNLKIDERLPSINELSKKHKISRDTVEKAYKVLKKDDIIIGKKGLGLFVNRNKFFTNLKVLFLIHDFSIYKLKTYESFRKKMKSTFQVDFEIYHSEKSIFLNLLQENKNRYDYFVIMPHFKSINKDSNNITDQIETMIQDIPRDRLVILDNIEFCNMEGIVQIYQDFENDIYFTLESILDKIKKYNKLFLVLPKEEMLSFHAKIAKGFKKFCLQQNLDHEVICELDKINFKVKNLYITLSDDDLVKILDTFEEKGFSLGKDVGVISYNESSLKRLLGITVISTDFEMMGDLASQMIFDDQWGTIKNPFCLIERNSI